MTTIDQMMKHMNDLFLADRESNNRYTYGLLVDVASLMTGLVLLDLCADHFLVDRKTRNAVGLAFLIYALPVLVAPFRDPEHPLDRSAFETAAQMAVLTNLVVWGYMAATRRNIGLNILWLPICAVSGWVFAQTLLTFFTNHELRSPLWCDVITRLYHL